MLLSQVLASGLSTTFVGVDTIAQAAQGWASAYVSYALDATVGVILPIFTGLEQEVLSNALASVFASSVVSDGASFASGIEAALIGFWLAPPVVFGTGVVSLTPPGLAALIGSILPANVLATTAQEAASNFASVIDSWTKTIIVTFPNGTTSTLM